MVTFTSCKHSNCALFKRRKQETEDGKQIATICSITAPLLAMQNEYDMLMAERNESFMEKIKHIRRIAAVF
jgi:hypothetical protein